jgi:addiction module RelE/StbE family toxin
MPQLDWSSEALTDLQELRDYIADRNQTAAASVFLRIVEHAGSLVEQPKLGRPGRVRGTRELVVPGTPFIIAYTVLDHDAIRILGVRHGARRWPPSFDS